MKWLDILEITEALIEAHPNVDPTQLNFVDLMNWVVALPNFDDDKSHCNERILETIQQTWMDEK